MDADADDPQVDVEPNTPVHPVPRVHAPSGRRPAGISKELSHHRLFRADPSAVPGSDGPTALRAGMASGPPRRLMLHRLARDQSSERFPGEYMRASLFYRIAAVLNVAAWLSAKTR